MNKEKNSLIKYLSVLLLVVILIIVLIFLVVIKNNKNSDKVREGLARLDSLSERSVSDIESEVDTLNEKDRQEKETQEAIEAGKGDENNLFDTMQVKDSTELKQLFANSCVVGDSMVESMADYEVLPSNLIVYQRGISVASSSDLMEQVIALCPQNVFMCFGINDLEQYQEYEDGADRFAEAYGEKIEQLRAGLPDASIYVNLINPFTAAAIERIPAYANKDVYNDALKKMCDEKGVPYINNTTLIEGHEELFDDDGIHPMPEYYPMWLTHMANEANL